MSSFPCNNDIILFTQYRTLSKCLIYYSDLHNLINIYDKKINSISLKRLLNKDLKNKQLLKTIGIAKFIKILHNLDNTSDTKVIIDILNNILKNNNDIVQKNTIIKIINTKFSQLYSKLTFNSKLIKKKCPHCNKVTEKLCHETYVICGYTKKGFDMEGCGNDWCFSCGKKLCKSWYVHNLFIEQNRIHNNHCCKLAAYKRKENHTMLYCTCHRKK